jgi:DNA-binding response OmpR family regulator
MAMALAHSLVRQWGGTIAFESEPRRGSSFTILLPCGEAPAPEPEPTRESILVVDDEAGIRGLMRKILRRERYDVVEAGSAEEALAVAAARAKPFELLLTDVMLPGMLGPDLARKMQEGQASLKVLFISGYTEDEAVRAGEHMTGARFLPKPFTLGALLGKVRETLDG